MRSRALGLLFATPLVILACNAAPQQSKPSEEILLGPPKGAELIEKEPAEKAYVLPCTPKGSGEVGLLRELYKLPSGKLIYHFTVEHISGELDSEIYWLALDERRIEGKVHLVTFQTKENRGGNGEVSTNDAEKLGQEVIRLRPGERKVFLSWKEEGEVELRYGIFHDQSCEMESSK